MPSEGMIWLKICLLKDGFCLKEILGLGWLFQLVKTVFLNKKNAFNSQAYHSIDFVFVIMTNWKWSLLLFCLAAIYLPILWHENFKYCFTIISEKQREFYRNAKFVSKYKKLVQDQSQSGNHLSLAPKLEVCFLLFLLRFGWYCIEEFN